VLQGGQVTKVSNLGLAPHSLNLLAAGATTLGEVLPLTSPARLLPLLPAVAWPPFFVQRMEPQSRIAGLNL
jgi:hypothetical protein